VTKAHFAEVKRSKKYEAASRSAIGARTLRSEVKKRKGRLSHGNSRETEDVNPDLLWDYPPEF